MTDDTSTPASPRTPPGSLTRRRFLGSAARGAAAAVAMPYFIPAAALGRDGATAPSNRINIGCIGMGIRMGEILGWFLSSDSAQILAVSDVYESKREKAKSRVETSYAEKAGGQTYKGCDAYNEFREILERSDIDAVIIAVPDHWHAGVAMLAMEAGKDVYCEKPLSLTIRQAESLVTAARRYGTVFQTGTQQRSSSEFRHACELVRNGRIGKVRQVVVNVGGPSTDKPMPEEPIPAGFDYDRWLGPAPWRPYNSECVLGQYGGGWRRFRDFSGGEMTNWGAHHFDIAQWGLGMDGSGPVEIHPPDGKEYKNLTYRYANDVVMIKGEANGVRFVGDDGTITVNRGYFKSTPDSIGKETIGPNDVRLYVSNNHMQNWLDCIKTRQEPIADVSIGCSSVTVCHLGNIAFWLGRSIRWDPEARQMIGDEEAARWLERPARANWSFV